MRLEGPTTGKVAGSFTARAAEHNRNNDGSIDKRERLGMAARRDPRGQGDGITPCSVCKKTTPKASSKIKKTPTRYTWSTIRNEEKGKGGNGDEEGTIRRPKTLPPLEIETTAVQVRSPAALAVHPQVGPMEFRQSWQPCKARWKTEGKTRGMLNLGSKNQRDARDANKTGVWGGHKPAGENRRPPQTKLVTLPRRAINKGG